MESFILHKNRKIIDSELNISSIIKLTRVIVGKIDIEAGTQTTIKEVWEKFDTTLINKTTGGRYYE